MKKTCYSKAPWHDMASINVSIKGLVCSDCGGNVSEVFMIKKLSILMDKHMREHGFKVCNYCGDYHKPGKDLFNLLGEWVCTHCSPKAVYRSIGEDGNPETMPGAEVQIAEWLLVHHRGLLNDGDNDDINTVISMFKPGKLDQIYKKIAR